MAQEILDELVSDVCSNSKYARICCELIRKIGKNELEKRSSYKEAIKHTRAKLHQIAASFQEKPIPYGRLFAELDALPRDLRDPATQAWCLKTMELHASTRERLTIISTFFQEILATIQPVHSVVDLACGFNPLALPWMPLDPGFSYQACDIYEDMNGFIDCYFDHFRIQGNAEICDLSEETPPGEFDLALMLKIIPCLEQLDKNLPQKLLREVNAKHILVSFPVASLGGKGKGMRDNYEKHFLDLTAGWPGSLQRFEFYSEMAFLLTRDNSA